MPAASIARAFAQNLLLFAVAAGASLEAATPLELEADSFHVEGDLNGFEKELTIEAVADGVLLVTLRLTAEEPVEPKPLTIAFDFPSVDINGYWNSVQSLDKVNYYRSGFTSGASGAAPLLCYYSNRLRNRLTVAASDALNPIVFNCGLREENVRFYATLRLFTQKVPPTSHYEITLRIDTSDAPYQEAIADAGRWWASMPEYRPAAVPDGARWPMYSTWYSYHQNLDADQLVEECRLSRALGCRAIIIDDGWQTNDSNRGYAYTGDWRPERLSEMRSFVDRVHAEGMAAILWYSLPFVGEKSDAYERFQGKYLYHWESQGAYVLDPRYPEVREHMIATYERALREWGLDGFKLDFIGWFKAYSDTELTAEEGRDYASVGAATDRLMTDITRRLQQVNPDVLLEFRQPYVGPVMRKYGNMFRGVDCPSNAAANRNEIANLRLLSDGTAVHSDMFIWREEESAESAALQLLNVMFSVPQVSVRLAEIRPEHREMLQHWLGYWNENREVLLDGRFIPGNPGANYPSLTAVADGKQITALYETPIVRQQADGLSTIDAINATGGDVVYLDLTSEWPEAVVTVFDARGAEVTRSEGDLAAGVHRFETPHSGMLRVETKR